MVSIERNEIILDRDTVLEKDHIAEIMEADVKTILLHKESTGASDYSIIHNTFKRKSSAVDAHGIGCGW